MHAVQQRGARLSLERIEEASRLIDPVFLNSPQFQSEPLGTLLGAELVLKAETVNPIRSFKGRGTDFLLLTTSDNQRALVCASAGNFGQGLAYAARKHKTSLTVFAAENANPFKLERMRQLGADVRLFGADFDAAKQRAREFADETVTRFIEDGREPAISEGAGTIAVELCRWPHAFDFVLVPLGNGALLAGIGTWMKSHSPATRIIAVCAAGAPAMANSLRSHKPLSTESVATIADGIAVRVPVPEALDDLAPLVDEVLLVDDDALVHAMRLVFQHHALVVEPAGIAGLAAAIMHKERFHGCRLATPLCGGNLTPDQMRKWLCAES
jgi:threonine dehydratase